MEHHGQPSSILRTLCGSQVLTVLTAAATEAVDQEVASAEMHDAAESRSKHAEVPSP